MPGTSSYLVPLRTVIRTPITAALAVSLVTAPAALALSPTIAWAEPQVQTQSEATPDKVETVWVYADATGQVSSVEVEAKLANRGGATTLTDESDLTDIEATTPGASVSRNASGALTWTCDGGEVAYEGSSQKEPPLQVRVSYLLDGRPVSPTELLGASGRVTIRYDYENSSRGTTRVNGYSERVFTPFLAITGMSLDPERFTNVSVTNGRIMEESGSLVVVGYALPGLQESLGSDLDDLDVPDFFEVSADVIDFKLGKTLTLVTPDLLSDLDEGELDLGEVTEAMDAMHEAMAALEGGAGQLADGLDRLKAGADAVDAGMAEFEGSFAQMGDASALTEGATQLTDLVNQLEAGTAQAAQGASALSAGLGQIQQGIGEASSSAGNLAEGIGDIAALVRSANEGLGAIANGVSTSRQAALDAIDDARQGVASAADAVSSDEVGDAAEAARAAAAAYEAAAGEASGLAAQAQAAQEAKATLDAIDTEGMTPEQVAAIEAAQAQLGEVSSGPLTNYASTAEGAADALDAAAERLDAAGTSLGEASDALDDARTAVEGIAADTSTVSGRLEGAAGGLDQASAGASSLQGGLAGAAGALGDASGSAADLSSGMGQMSSGITQHKGSVADLAAALSTLGQSLPAAAEGISALHQGTAALAQGMGAAATGADQLASGISQFDEEGVSRLADELDSRIGGLGDRIDAISGAARDYDNFSGVADGQTSSVRLIYQVDAIE